MKSIDPAMSAEMVMPYLSRSLDEAGISVNVPTENRGKDNTDPANHEQKSEDNNTMSDELKELLAKIQKSQEEQPEKTASAISDAMTGALEPLLKSMELQGQGIAAILKGQIEEDSEEKTEKENTEDNGDKQLERLAEIVNAALTGQKDIAERLNRIEKTPVRRGMTSTDGDEPVNKDGAEDLTVKELIVNAVESDDFQKLIQKDPRTGLYRFLELFTDDTGYNHFWDMLVEEGKTSPNRLRHVRSGATGYTGWATVKAS
jgi:hypothetical protein